MAHTFHCGTFVKTGPGLGNLPTPGIILSANGSIGGKGARGTRMARFPKEPTIVKPVFKILALMSVSLFAVAADAATMLTATISGVVRDGVDRNGLFGAVGADLTGNAYSMVFSFMLDPLTNYATDGFGIVPQNGYQGFGAASAPSRVALTIGGTTRTLSGEGQAYTARALPTPQAAPFSHQVNYYIQNADGIGVAGGLTTNSAPFTTLNATEDFSYSLTDADRAFEASNGFLTDADGGQINFTQYRIAQVASISASAVPEPATWAMMLAGFGLIGCAARRRMQVSADVLA